MQHTRHRIQFAISFYIHNTDNDTGRQESMAEEGTGKYSAFLQGETAVNGGLLQKHCSRATTISHRQKTQKHKAKSQGRVQKARSFTRVQAMKEDPGQAESATGDQNGECRKVLHGE